MEQNLDTKREFMRLVRAAARPYVADGWGLGAGGLRRQDESGHWAHFWFWNHNRAEVGWVQPRVGTTAPYLLRVFNRQRTDRPPTVNYYAAHSTVTPLEDVVELRAGDGPDPVALDETPRERLLQLGAATAWLEDRFARALPEMVARSSDESLLVWLADPSRSPRSGDLRFAALLAYHLRRDNQVEEILVRAGQTSELEDAAWIAKGHDLSYQVNRGMSYPQFWTHKRFVRHLRECPRD